MAMLFKKPASNGLGQAPNQHRDIRQRSRKLSQVSTCPLSIIARLVPLNAKGGRYAPRRRDERPFHKRLQCHRLFATSRSKPTSAPVALPLESKQDDKVTEDAPATQRAKGRRACACKANTCPDTNAHCNVPRNANEHVESLDRSAADAQKR